MKTRTAMLAAGAALLLAAGCRGPAGPEETAAGPGALPPPPRKAGVDIMAALRARRSTRRFDKGKPIPEEVLGAVLWAADGVNRPNGKHTSPCALGLRYMRIYVCRADGAWRYDQDAHRLLRVTGRDLRARVGRQKFMADAPVVLVLTGDLAVFASKAPRLGAAGGRACAQATAGCIAQNVYLAAAACGLGTVMAGGLRAEELRKGLALKKDEVPLYIMPLGYPRK